MRKFIHLLPNNNVVYFPYMFWRNKEPQTLPFFIALVFGFGCLFSVFLALGIVVWRGSFDSSYDIKESYEREMVALREWVVNPHESSDGMIKRAESVFFSVRVPEDRLQAHLHAALELQKISRSLDNRTSNDVRTQLFNLVLPLSEDTLSSL